jgi:hypothetical protein
MCRGADGAFPAGTIFEVDRPPVTAVVTHHAVDRATDIRFSNALIQAGVPDHPEGHDMVVSRLRVYAP